MQIASCKEGQSDSMKIELRIYVLDVFKNDKCNIIKSRT